jgi:hypothetical protein
LSLFACHLKVPTEFISQKSLLAQLNQISRVCDCESADKMNI